MADAPLAVLACEGCGEPLAIGDADWVLCPACGKREVVPEAYRALRDANVETSGARERITAFYRQLARGPRWDDWLLDRFGLERTVSIFTAMVVVYGVALLASPILVVWAAWQLFAESPRVNFYQVLGPAERGLVYGVVVFVALLVPAIAWWLTGWNRQRRRELLAAALAAGRPKREGGPALCRACGAPLSVATGACAATCLYCRTENLIVPSGRVLASAEKRALTLDEVIEEEAWQRRKVRRGLVAAMLLPTLAGLVMLLGMWLFAGEEYAWASGGALRCANPVCTEWQQVRLHRDQPIEIVLAGTASGPPKVHLEGQRITLFPEEWISVADAKADDAGRARLVAPWDGWFRIVVEVPGPADASFRTKD